MSGPEPISALGATHANHQRFIQWATSKRGVQVNGVEPAIFPGKGIGMIATRAIKEGEAIVEVPVNAIFVVEPDIPSHKGSVASAQNLSVHGRLAERLAFSDPVNGEEDSVDNIAPWLDVMPTYDDLRRCMPHLWSPSLQTKLPCGAMTRFAKSRANFDRDVEALLEQPRWKYVVSPEERASLKERFIRGWLLVNSRCFYWDYPMTIVPGRAPRKRPRKKRPTDDCLAMCPYADYFNHIGDGSGCSVEYNEVQYTVRTNRDYALGEEILVSYGTHSNDYLLIEYGFIMSDNQADSILLDTHILARLSESHTELLKEHKLLREYSLDCKRLEVCHRTRSALQLLVTQPRQWERFIRGVSDGAGEQQLVDRLLIEIYEDLFQEAKSNLSVMEKMDVDNHEVYAKETLVRRWLQIQEIASSAREVTRSQMKPIDVEA